jgi:hypothetical protein
LSPRGLLPGAALGLLCAVSLGLGAGCGASDAVEGLTKAQYLAQMRSLVAEVRADAKELREAIASPRGLGDTVVRARRDLEDVAVRLREMSPPDAIAALHDRLTGVVEQFSALVGRAQTAIGSGDIAALIGLAPAVQEEIGELGQVSREFAANGYAIESDARSGQAAQ